MITDAQVEAAMAAWKDTPGTQWRSMRAALEAAAQAAPTIQPYTGPPLSYLDENGRPIVSASSNDDLIDAVRKLDRAGDVVVTTEEWAAAQAGGK